MKDKNIKYWLWGILITILLGFTCIVSFGQINPTIKSARLDSIRSRVPGAKIWFTDNRGGQAWLRVSGDTMYLGDVTGEKKISSIGAGGGADPHITDSTLLIQKGIGYNWLDINVAPYSYAYFDMLCHSALDDSYFQTSWDSNYFYWQSYDYLENLKYDLSFGKEGNGIFKLGYQDNELKINMDPTQNGHFEQYFTTSNGITTFSTYWDTNYYYWKTYDYNGDTRYSLDFGSSVGVFNISYYLKDIIRADTCGIKLPQKIRALTGGIPTSAEISAAVGRDARQVGAGFQVTIKDGNGTYLLYKVESDGTNWYYVVMTKAL